MQWLAGFPTRLPGTPGHDQASRELLEKIRSVAGVRTWVQPFSVVVPETEKAELTVDDGPFRGAHRVYPLWPASARLHTTPEEGLRGRLVYVGQGTCDRLPARTLRGQIAAMEIGGGFNWQAVYNFGASAILLLGSDDLTQAVAHSHLTRIPLNVPRFYLPDGPLARELRGAERTGRLYCRARWKEAAAQNLYALVPPAAGAPAGPAIAILAPYDSVSIVPELAPGADAAVDACVALNLLRHFARHPPARPLLFAFVDGYVVNQLGVREMLAAVAVTPEKRNIYVQEDAATVASYAGYARLLDALGPYPEAVRRLGRGEYAPLQGYVKDEVARDVVAIETALHPKRLALYAAGADARAGLQNEVEELAALRTALYAAQNRLLAKPDNPMTPLSDALLRRYREATGLARGAGDTADDRRPFTEVLWERVGQRVRGQLAEAESRMQVHRQRDRLRQELVQALGLAGRQDRPVGFLLGLDLSDSGTAAGPRSYCRHLGLTETANASGFLSWLRALAAREADALWPGDLRRAVDLGPLAGMDAPESFAVGNLPNPTSPALSFATPAATWATLDCLQERVDTPLDQAERLDWQRLSPQIDVTLRLCERLAGQTDFAPGFRTALECSRVTGSVLNLSPGYPVPRVPMRGYLTTISGGAVSGGRGVLDSRTPAAGVRLDEFRFSGTDGRFYFDAWPYAEQGQRRHFVQSYLVTPDGRIRRAVDMNCVEKGVRLDVDITEASPTPRRAVVFTCEELTLLELFDPRFLQNLPTGALLDARRADKPQRVNSVLSGGQWSAFLEPGIRWVALLRAGTLQNRMALLNIVPSDDTSDLGTRRAMRGFELRERLESIPAEVALRDLSRLDQRRLTKYRKAGITSRAIDNICRDSRRLEDEAAQAKARDDGAGLVRAATGGLANEMRAYQAIQNMANDVVRAAIFLLLALVPFSIALERLLFASPHVYRQILGTGVILAAMIAALWSFHPAFRISNQPLMIIMAFGIVFMSLLVLSIIYRKFSGSLEEARSGRAESSGAHTSRGGIALSAFRLGLVNMRKRAMRTVLTGATVVLITFALLCFTSVTRYADQRERTLRAAAPFTGILIREPQCRPLPPEALPHVANALGAAREPVPQYWWANPANVQWRVHVRNPATGAAISLRAALGLSGAEAGLTRVDEVLPNWPRFAAGGGCYLAGAAAEQLRVKAGDTVTVAGRNLEVAGVFDAAAFDRRIRGLTGESLMPADYSVLAEQQRWVLEAGSLEQLTSEIESGAALEPSLAVPALGAASVLIVPASFLDGMPGASLRGMAVRAGPAEEAKSLAAAMAKRFAFPIYHGSPDGVRVIVATALAAQGPKNVLILLIIAGLIIFNTMLNSIAERKREIHVYTSLGLAPVHVGALFVAEAAAYGLMGSIFGYVIGQGVATLMSRLGWLGGITLNYSGTDAIATMLLVLVVVVLSALAPAFMAGKLAMPAAEMKWRVPAPTEDVIRDTLPFTVTAEAADGVMRFLYEYLDAHREGSIGYFSTDRLRAVPAQAGRRQFPAAELTVWLAPYDLGVRQDVRLAVRETEEEDVFEIEVRMTRRAGETRTWWKLNRVFLGALRKQLLGWRKLKTERVLEYIAAGRRMLQV